MKKSFLLIAIATVAFASCTKSTVMPPAVSAGANKVTVSAKGKPVTPPAAPGGPGGGGSTTPSNLDVYIKQLTAGWQVFLGSGEPVPGIPDATGTITMLITFKSNNTFTLVATDNVTKAQITHSGTWQFTIPAILPIDESGLLVLTSGGTTLLSGLLYFIHPGIIQYQTPTNNLESSLSRSAYVFQKA